MNVVNTVNAVSAVTSESETSRGALRIQVIAFWSGTLSMPAPASGLRIHAIHDIHDIHGLFHAPYVRFLALPQNTR